MEQKIEKYNIITNDVGIFHIYIYFPAGSIYEDEKNSGCSHMLEHMLFKNKGRASLNLAKDMTSIGGRYNAATYKDVTFYFIKTHMNQYKKAIDYIKQITMNVNFKDSDLNIERNVVIEEFNQTKDDFSHTFHNMANLSLMAEDNIYTKSVIGNIKVLKTVSSSYLSKYYKEHYSSPVIVVNCDTRVLGKATWYLKKSFGAPSTYDFTDINLKSQSNKIEPKIVFLNKTYAQYTTRLSFMTLSSEAVYENTILRFIHYILAGAGLYSLLSHNVRELRGLVYTINANLEVFRYTGFYIIQFGSSSPKTDYIISLILDIISKIKKKGLSATKLDFYRNSFLNTLKVRFANQDARTEFHGDNFFYGSSLSEEEFQKIIQNVTNEELIRVSNIMLDYSHMGVISMGSYNSVDAMTKKTQDILESYH